MRISDWSSDVCSSDLSVIQAVRRTAERPRLADAAARVSEHVNDRYTAQLPRPEATVVPLRQEPPASTFEPDGPVEHAVRSEERRVGKEVVSTFRSWWSPDH